MVEGLKSIDSGDEVQVGWKEVVGKELKREE